LTLYKPEALKFWSLPLKLNEEQKTVVAQCHMIFEIVDSEINKGTLRLECIYSSTEYYNLPPEQIAVCWGHAAPREAGENIL